VTFHHLNGRYSRANFPADASVTKYFRNSILNGVGILA